jgi:Ca2+-binding RTX toxin-like protein
MRLGLAVAAFAAVVVPSFSLAADRLCTDIALLSPAAGQHFIGTRPIHFSWSGEPKGTVTRELHLATLHGAEVVTPLDGRFSDTVKVKMTGDLAWAVVFKDADGKVLCASPAGLIAAGAGGGSSAGAGGGSLSDTVAGATPPAPAPKPAVFMKDGRLVIVLQNSPYTGPYTKLVNANGYNMTNEDLMGASGVEFHGNNVRNEVIGSPGNDLIWLYDGNDQAEGGAGDDILVGGEGDDKLTDINPFRGIDVDALYGGPGDDDLNTVDFDISDSIYTGSGVGTTSQNGRDTLTIGPDGP